MSNSSIYLNNIVFLDADTINKNINLDRFNELGNFTAYKNTSKELIYERVKDAHIILTNKVNLNKEVLENCNSLKLICVTATGTNNIDHEAARNLNIKICNVKDYSTASVAQLTLTMALNHYCSIQNYLQYTKAGKWCESTSFTCQAWKISELKGKTWGIIGLGAIGKKVANLASAFDCKTQYYSTSGKNNDLNFNQVGLEKLLLTSDIISIHAPLNDKTLNLISKNELEKLKDECIIINVGRGGIINEKDLYEVLLSKKIYVSLDVAENEPMDRDSYLFKLKEFENVHITPHIAWASIEAQQTLMNSVFNQVKVFLKEYTR